MSKVSPASVTAAAASVAVWSEVVLVVFSVSSLLVGGLSSDIFLLFLLEEKTAVTLLSKLAL